MKEDFKTFTLLQKILAIIDFIIRPKESTYPFAYSDNLSPKLKPVDCMLVIKRFIKDGKQHIWYIRKLF